MISIITEDGRMIGSIPGSRIKTDDLLSISDWFPRLPRTTQPTLAATGEMAALEVGAHESGGIQFDNLVGDAPPMQETTTTNPATAGGLPCTSCQKRAVIVGGVILALFLWAISAYGDIRAAA